MMGIVGTISAYDLLIYWLKANENGWETDLYVGLGL